MQSQETSTGMLLHIAVMWDLPSYNSVQF